MERSRLVLNVVTILSTICIGSVASALETYRTLKNCHEGPGTGSASHVIKPFSAIKEMTLQTFSDGEEHLTRDIQIQLDNTDITHPLAKLVGLSWDKSILKGTYNVDLNRGVRPFSGEFDEQRAQSHVELRTKVSSSLASAFKARGVTTSDDLKVEFYMDDVEIGEVKILGFSIGIVKAGTNDYLVRGLQGSGDYRNYVKCFVTRHYMDTGF